MRDAINSYRQLPVNLYQIQTKFRDEVRPRFGLMRGREFMMKDAYSFHASRESLDETYEKMRDAYGAIFHRCALDHVAVEADTGNIGGSASHEFMVLAQSGEDAVVSLPELQLRRERGEGDVEVLRRRSRAARRSRSSRRSHTPGTQSIDDVGKFLGKPTSQLVKTLVFDTDQGLRDGARPRRPRRQRDQDQELTSAREFLEMIAGRALRSGHRRSGRLLRSGRHEGAARARRRLAERPHELGRRRATRRDTHLDRRESRPRFPGAGVRRFHDRLRRRSLPALRRRRWRSIAASKSATSSSSARSTPRR